MTFLFIFFAGWVSLDRRVEEKWVFFCINSRFRVVQKNGVGVETVFFGVRLSSCLGGRVA